MYTATQQALHRQTAFPLVNGRASPSVRDCSRHTRSSANLQAGAIEGIRIDPIMHEAQFILLLSHLPKLHGGVILFLFFWIQPRPMLLDSYALVLSAHVILGAILRLGHDRRMRWSLGKGSRSSSAISIAPARR